MHWDGQVESRTRWPLGDQDVPPIRRMPDRVRKCGHTAEWRRDRCQRIVLERRRGGGLRGTGEEDSGGWRRREGRSLEEVVKICDATGAGINESGGRRSELEVEANLGKIWRV